MTLDQDALKPSLPDQFSGAVIGIADLARMGSGCKNGDLLELPVPKTSLVASDNGFPMRINADQKGFSLVG